MLLLLFLLGAAGIAAFGVLSVVLLERSQLERIDAQLSAVAADFARMGRPTPQPSSNRQVPSDFRILFFDPTGGLIVQLGAPDQAGTVPDLPAMDIASTVARGDAAFTAHDQANSEIQWRVRTAFQPSNASQPEDGTVAVALSLETSNAMTARLRTIEIVAGLAMIAVMVAVAAVLVRLGLRPLRRMEDAAEAIAAGDVEQRVGETDPATETGRLGAAFNVMVARLSEAMRRSEDSEQRMRAFVADASHELRTPLTTVRGYAELYRHSAGGADESVARDLMERIEASAVQMSLLVEDMLLLARLDEERPLDQVETDLAAMLAEVAADARTRAPDRTIAVVIAPGSLRVVGDDHRLRQVFTNLVNNALVHTPASAAITIEARIRPADQLRGATSAEAGADLPDAGDYVVVEVTDTGPGIPIEKAGHVFDRFFQVNASRSGAAGSGLGLAIVAAILSAHGARIQLFSSNAGGTTFRVVFARI
ncbi:sensor histidine kinase [Nocardia asteroides]|uniref:sensor histidine kinase n=1 Tax=Nocardia asteroides TaxID=1824 RepID=UPI00343EFC38